MAVVGVLGLGKLGLPLALVLAAAGHEVLTWDVDANVREAVQSRKALIDEPRVVGMLQQYELEMIQPTQLAKRADVVFVIVPTPSRDDGEFDPAAVLNAIQALRAGGKRHLVVGVISTVSPGTCRHQLLPLIESYGLQLIYCPVVIALGTVVRDLRNPELQIIGHETDVHVGELVVSNVLRTIAPHTVQCPMSFESAELTKLSGNVYSAFKVSFANLTGQLCEIYGGDVDEVLGALALHHRIGPVSLTAGAGYGGPCWPRDVRAFTAAGGKLGTVVEGMNQEHLRWILRKVLTVVKRSSSFAIIGRAYKDGTNYRIDSFGDQLSDLLTTRGLTNVGVREADVVVIAQPLRGLNLCDSFKPNAAVIDLWRTHRYLDSCDGVRYLPFGVGESKETTP